MKKIFNKLKEKTSSIKNKLILSHVLTALIPIIIISLLTYNINKNILISKIGSFSEISNSQTANIIDNYLLQLENNASPVFGNNDIISFNPMSKDIDDYEYTKIKRDIKEYLLSIELLQNYNDFLLIYKDGSTIGKISDTTQNMNSNVGLYSKLKSIIDEGKAKSTWVTGLEGNFDKIYYIKQINNYAIMITSVGVDNFNNVVSATKNDDKSKIMLLNENEDIIYSNYPELIGKKFIDENIDSNIVESNDELLINSDCKNGWKVVNSIQKKYILKEVYITELFTIGIALICIIIIFIFGTVFSKKISASIHNIVIKMKKAENGDLTVKSNVIGNDEISMLNRSFNNMIMNIRKLVQDSKNVSSVVNNECFSMKEMAKQNYTLAKNISSSMEDMTESSIIQSKELDNTKQAIDNLSEKISLVAENIYNICAISNETKAIGNKSLKIVEKQQIKNNDRDEITKDIFLNVQILVDSIKRIEDVIKLIDDINEQTNLLSLNASIEAERVGHMGKGFAVVAGEIRKLADKSKKSTYSVSKIIKEVYEKANLTITLISSSQNAFKDAKETVDHTNDSLKDMVKLIYDIDYEVNNIKDLINDINDEKDKNNNAVNNIRAIGEKIATRSKEVLEITKKQDINSEKLSKGADNLNNSTNYMSNSLDKFIIE